MATKGAEPVFIDTNVLVHAAVSSSPWNHAARAALTCLHDDGCELWISRQVVREYLAVLSRPQWFSQPAPIPVLISDVRKYLDQFRMAEDGAAVTETLLELVAHVPLAGKQVHDANIVATMQAHGLAQLLTHNVADFQRFGAKIHIIPIEGPATTAQPG